jgi:hypothetical protein
MYRFKLIFREWMCVTFCIHSFRLSGTKPPSHGSTLMPVKKTSKHPKLLLQLILSSWEDLLLPLLLLHLDSPLVPHLPRAPHLCPLRPRAQTVSHGKRQEVWTSASTITMLSSIDLDCRCQRAVCWCLWRLSKQESSCAIFALQRAPQKSEHACKAFCASSSWEWDRGSSRSGRGGRVQRSAISDTAISRTARFLCTPFANIPTVCAWGRKCKYV